CVWARLTRRGAALGPPATRAAPLPAAGPAALARLSVPVAAVWGGGGAFPTAPAGGAALAGTWLGGIATAGGRGPRASGASTTRTLGSGLATGAEADGGGLAGGGAGGRAPKAGAGGGGAPGGGGLAAGPPASCAGGGAYPPLAASADGAKSVAPTASSPSAGAATASRAAWRRLIILPVETRAPILVPCCQWLSRSAYGRCSERNRADGPGQSRRRSRLTAAVGTDFLCRALSAVARPVHQPARAVAGRGTFVSRGDGSRVLVGAGRAADH